MKVKCELEDYSINDDHRKIEVKSVGAGANTIVIQIGEKVCEVSGRQLIEAVKNCMNVTDL